MGETCDPSTPEQRRVIYWCGILLCIVCGAVAFWRSFGAEAEHAKIVGQLRILGMVLWGAAALMYGVRVVMKRLCG